MKVNLILAKSKEKDQRYMKMEMLIMESSFRTRKKEKEFCKRNLEIHMRDNFKKDASVDK